MMAMFKKGMLRPNYLGAIVATVDNLGPEAFYPPLNDMGKEWLEEWKMDYKKAKALRKGGSVVYDVPDDEYVKYILYTDAEIAPPYKKAKEKWDCDYKIK